MNAKKITIKDMNVNYTKEKGKKDPKASNSLHLYNLKMLDYMLF